MDSEIPDKPLTLAAANVLTSEKTYFSAVSSFSLIFGPFCSISEVINFLNYLVKVRSSGAINLPISRPVFLDALDLDTAFILAYSPVDLYLIIGKSILKNQV